MVYQHDDLGNAGQITDWYSAGARVSVAFTEHFKLLGEAGYDRVTKSNGAAPQYLAKFTVAPAISADRGLLDAPGAAPLLHLGDVERGGSDRHRRFGHALHHHQPS